jgi:hypothetical protein
MHSFGPQPCQNPQGQGGLTRTAAGGGNDKSFNGTPLYWFLFARECPSSGFMKFHALFSHPP